MPELPALRAAPLRIRIRAAVVPIALIAAVSGAPAQTVQPAPPALEDGIPLGRGLFSPSIQIGWEYSDNIFRRSEDDLRSEGKVSSGLTQIRPVMRFLLPYSNSRLGFEYSPVFRDYDRVELPDKVAHNARIDNSLVLGTGMQVDFEGRFVRGIVETTNFDPAEQIRFSTTPYRERSGLVSWTWEHPSRWGTVLSLEEERVRFLNEEGAVPEEEAPPVFFDYRSRSAVLDATWAVRDNLRLFGGLRRTKTVQTVFGEDITDVDRDGTVDRPANGRLDPFEIGQVNRDGKFDLLEAEDVVERRDIRLGARGAFGRRVAGELGASYTRLSSSIDSGNDFQGVTIRTSAEVFLSESNQVRFELSRQPVQSLVNQSSVFDFYSATVGWSFAPNPIHDFRVTARLLDASYTGSRRDDTYTLNAAWGMLLSRRAGFRLTALRTQRDSTLDSLSYEETRLTLGWTLGWQSP